MNVRNKLGINEFLSKMDFQHLSTRIHHINHLLSILTLHHFVGTNLADDDSFRTGINMALPLDLRAIHNSMWRPDEHIQTSYTVLLPWHWAFPTSLYHRHTSNEYSFNPAFEPVGHDRSDGNRADWMTILQCSRGV